ncbi:predicted protein [Chaetoceros tenuissimus]|uniref:Uncharacterized protein n=1 Tax=Chaetoceros tenuissimus TaxID=426638 RepID=A0AAD3HG84_9STRA|nr:predicted protein [Chaetoceros tenuissimus]
MVSICDRLNSNILVGYKTGNAMALILSTNSDVTRLSLMAFRKQRDTFHKLNFLKGHVFPLLLCNARNIGKCLKGWTIEY